MTDTPRTPDEQNNIDLCLMGIRQPCHVDNCGRPCEERTRREHEPETEPAPA